MTAPPFLVPAPSRTYPLTCGACGLGYRSHHLTTDRLGRVRYECPHCGVPYLPPVLAPAIPRRTRDVKPRTKARTVPATCSRCGTPDAPHYVRRRDRADGCCIPCRIKYSRLQKQKARATEAP